MLVSSVARRVSSVGTDAIHMDTQYISNLTANSSTLMDTQYISNLTATSSTLVDLLRWRALHQPDSQAYVFLLDGETAEDHLTYGELGQQARAIASLLQNSGATAELTLLLYPPGLDYITAFFGCLY